MPIFHLEEDKNDCKLQPPGSDEFEERAPEDALAGSSRNLLWWDHGTEPGSSEGFFISDIMKVDLMPLSTLIIVVIITAPIIAANIY